MKKYQIQFLSLLRTGLWNNSVELDLFIDKIDWSKILNLAKEQAVIGIIFDAINMMPIEYQPSANIMRMLFMTTLEIEKHNDILNHKLLEIKNLFQENNISSVLLKGQGVAQNYPHPNHRQSGDIDIYVGQDQYEKACNLVVKKGLVGGKEIKSKKHFHFTMDGVVVEIHQIAENLENPKKNKLFQNWTILHLKSNLKRSWRIKDSEIMLPPINFDAIYIFAHLFGHYIATGIGLRQISDWMLFLNTFRNEIDNYQLEKDLNAFGLIDAWQCFGCILVKYLGFPINEFPLYNKKLENKAFIILKDYILESGNFGQYDKKAKNIYAENINQKIVKLTQRTKRVIKIFSLFPTHASFYYFNFLKRGFKQKIDD